MSDDIDALFGSLFAAGATNAYYYSTHAAAEADKANRTNGHMAVVLNDEEQGGLMTYYVLTAGAWVLQPSSIPVPLSFSGIPESQELSREGKMLVRENGQSFVVALSDLIAGIALSTSDIAEGDKLFFTAERVDDRVGAFLEAGTNMAIDYDDIANRLSVGMADTAMINGGYF